MMKKFSKQMNFHHYSIVSKAGEGTFSTVLKAKNTNNGKFVAIKVMKNEFESIKQVERLRELQALKRLRGHKNVIELLEVLYDENSGKLALVFELMAENMYEFICSRKKLLKVDRLRSYIYQLIQSIDYMHQKGIFHRDIKPENILLLNEKIKLADFGSCKGCYSKMPFTEYISTRWYRAPECLLTDGYYAKAMDIWGIGCVFYEMITFKALFPGDNESDQVKRIHKVLGSPTKSTLAKFKKYTLNSNINFSFPHTRGTGMERMLPREYQKKNCVDLLNKLLRYDPEKRITSKQALQHPFFEKEREKERSLSKKSSFSQIISFSASEHSSVKTSLPNISKPFSHKSLPGRLDSKKEKKLRNNSFNNNKLRKSVNVLPTFSLINSHRKEGKKGSKIASPFSPKKNPLKKTQVHKDGEYLVKSGILKKKKNKYGYENFKLPSMSKLGLKANMLFKNEKNKSMTQKFWYGNNHKKNNIIGGYKVSKYKTKKKKKKKKKFGNRFPFGEKKYYF